MRICLALVFVMSFSGTTWSQESPTLKEIPDLTYLDAAEISVDSSQRLNLILPAVQTDSTPLLIWIGGGAWSYVNRHMEMDLARRFAAEGIAVASVGHRLSSAVWRDSTLSEGVQHPAHINDLAAAFHWLWDRADTYGYDQNRIYVGGFSSGAHLAALLALDKRYLEKQGLSTDQIKGIIPIGGTYDIPDYHRAFREGSRPQLAEQHVEAVFGPTNEDHLHASPISYLDNLSVPIFLISETNTYPYAIIFEDRIRETEFRDFQVLHVHRMGHAELWRNISHHDESPYRRMMIDFILAGG